MFIKLIWLTFAASLSNMSFAQQVDPIQCPKRITVSQEVGQSLDTGWEPINRKDSHPLVSVSLFEGHPKEMAELVIAEVLSGDLGEYDVSVGEAVSSETLRMANAIELKELAQAVPGAISPELLIEESQLPQATKTKIVDAIKNARMAQAGQMPGPIAGQGA